MKSIITITKILEIEFRRIHMEQMQGIPILNPAIDVQTLGFDHYQGRILGVLITPWLMNVVMLPRDDENWSNSQVGQKKNFQFPSRSYRFMANKINGIGPCHTHSLYSPMNQFSSHSQAVNSAHAFLNGLMIEKKTTKEDLVDEELLGKVLRREVGCIPDKKSCDKNKPAKMTLSRRNLLRGRFVLNQHKV